MGADLEDGAVEAGLPGEGDGDVVGGGEDEGVGRVGAGAVRRQLTRFLCRKGWASHNCHAHGTNEQALSNSVFWLRLTRSGAEDRTCTM